MYKYISIKAVMNYLPDGLMEEWSEADIVKNLVMGYRANIKNSFLSYDFKFCVSKIVNHEAKIPHNTKGIFDISYSYQKITPVQDESESTNNPAVYLRKNFLGETVTVFQSMAWTSIREYTNDMRYAGQSTDFVYNGCLNYLCDTCINWSISRDLQTITTDVKEGYLYILYKADVTDEEGDIMIPDEILLLQALSYYVIGKYYQSVAFRREQGAEEKFAKYMQLANNAFQEFWSRHLLINLDVENNVFNTQGVNQIGQKMWQRNKNIYR